MTMSADELGPLAVLQQRVAGWSAGPNPAEGTPDANGRTAGFLLGVWHGARAPITLVRSLFRDDVHVFEVHNTGKGYLFGFLLGVTLWAGGPRVSPRVKVQKKG